MIQFSVASTMTGAPARPGIACEWLYKDDHPRSIDRYIDFFGTGTPRAGGAADRCGDVFLESLA
jgi:hypothetical protein